VSRRIHLIFKTHLDVGFTNLAGAVVQQYFDQHIPAALALARRMREENQRDHFIWTTGSWLIYQYLEQASPQARREMESAIQLGDIAWHALPFTTHTELMDADLFRFGLSLSKRLDNRFGKRTIAAKFTDVPGHTRGIVPLLVEAGVQFLQIGVNPGSTVPAVPSLFRWRDPTGSELAVMYESGYGSAFIVPGIQDSLAFGHSIDNRGPQTPEEVQAIYRGLRERYPQDEIVASTLNDFAEKLSPIVDSLPVVTQEIGDTWIHGIGSDPIKISQFRELLRLRSEWIEIQPSLKDNPVFDRFQHRLLVVPEHTWGMDEKEYLHDHQAYSAQKFSAARGLENFKVFETSWIEKRAYIDAALRELEGTPLASEAIQSLDRIKPSMPDLSTWEKVSPGEIEDRMDYFDYKFDAKTGSLVMLVDRRTGVAWSDKSHPLGLLRYQTFSANDYERFFHQYIIPAEQNNAWSREDFTKPGLESANPQSRFWQPEVQAIYRMGKQWLFHLIGETEANQQYGCPKDFFLQYTFTINSEIQIDLEWFNKPACRLPEAAWFSFVPLTSSDADWKLEKLGQEVSPLDVVENGNRHLHASGKYIVCREKTASLSIAALDSPLVAPGVPSLLNFNNDLPDLSQGMHFNLHNNLWGTNFPMWFEEDCRFRFILRF